ncbi:hypothetical protein CK203_047044 [Vitis vinifera]|uniref:Uncharacterized protein n=2 Tax=Vitis vinifera TaxID=29760 RepID=A5BX48_VITVI|nr:hypothetical protein CK203_047044 [Vitis vinifera]CAN70656.1 hypothetical protein VITISV_039489 [Vitis vinifera]
MHPHRSLCTLIDYRVLRVARDFTIGNSLGCRGSACVEVMTTLHGSAPSLRRCAEGCVPPEGLVLHSQCGLPFWVRVEGSPVQFSKRSGIDQQIVTVDQFTTSMASIKEALANLRQEIGIVQTTVLEDTHACMDRIEQCMRQLRVSDSSSTWDDLDSIPLVSLLAKFRMLDIERYTGVGCLYIHLRLYSIVMRAHGLDESQMITMFPLSLSGAMIRAQLVSQLVRVQLVLLE